MAFSQSHHSFQPKDLTIVKEEKFVFETEWYDSQACLIRKYLLSFYPKDQTAEMVSSTYFPNILSTTSKTEECS
jgi:hypothetical protein